MNPGGETVLPGETASLAGDGRITVHYWAAARAVAGVGSEEILADSALSLIEVRERAVALHPGTRLGEVLAVCAVLVGDQPASSSDPAMLMVPVGSTVEFLPPFAGG